MANLFFKSAQHQTRFLSIIKQLGKVYHGKLDPEYGAALYLLTADSGIWREAEAYVGPHQIDITTMLEDMYLSSGESILVSLAGNLFNGNQSINPVEFVRLDQNNFLLALTALQIRRYSLLMSELENEPVTQ